MDDYKVRSAHSWDRHVGRILADGSYDSRYGDGPVRVVEYTLAEVPDETCRLVTTLRRPRPPN